MTADFADDFEYSVTIYGVPASKSHFVPQSNGTIRK